jgi:hypothetical protein
MTLRGPARRIVEAASLVLVFAALTRTASADPKDPKIEDSLEACASAAERGQAARLAGRLVQARNEFRVCGARQCPQIVQEDCLRWLSEINQELPSVVFRARDGRNRDVISVRVYVNGKLLVEELDGKAIALDPGRYDVRYETASGAVGEETVLLRLGERLRELSVRFSEALESNGTLAPPKPPLPPASERPRRPSSKPVSRSDRQPARSDTLGYVFGSAALASFGAFAYFELEGQDRYHELQAGCGRTRSCAEEEVNAARTDFILAGSFLAASAVLLGLSTWQFLSPSHQSSSARVGPRRLPGTFSF